MLIQSKTFPTLNSSYTLQENSILVSFILALDSRQRYLKLSDSD